MIQKTRPDDFKGEIDHVDALLSGKATLADSPISLVRGLETMMVAAAAFVSHRENRSVKINYDNKWTLDSIH